MKVPARTSGARGALASVLGVTCLLALSPSALAGQTGSVTTLAAGYGHSCGVTADGEAYCWGRNERGELGDGSTMPRERPTAVTGGHAFQALAVGARHTCGVTADGEAWCWGANPLGELGNGTSEHRSEPVQVAGPQNFRAIAAGMDHTCALTAGGGATAGVRTSPVSWAAGSVASHGLSPSRPLPG